MKECSNQLTKQVIGCAIEVHRNLGSGLLESAYEQCLAYELSKSRVPFKLQIALPVNYKNVQIDCGYRLDVLVDNRLILELKVVETLQRVHEAQILTYMKLTNISTGLLINFNEATLVKGIKRYKN